MINQYGVKFNCIEIAKINDHIHDIFGSDGTSIVVASIIGSCDGAARLALIETNNLLCEFHGV